jgi:hypothetical protein
MSALTKKPSVSFSLLSLAAFSLSFTAEAQIPKTPDASYLAPADQALLVFDRPRHRQASQTGIRVVTPAGKCIAVLENDWQMAAPIWPGKQMLMLVTGMSPPVVQLLEVNLSAGKTYVVRLRPRVNVKSPVEIEVLRRADQPLEAFPAAVREQRPAQPSLRECTEWVSWKRSKIASKAGEAKRRWDEADEEFRDRNTVHRNDGWTATEVQPP